jgi:hypothetical protein
MILAPRHFVSVLVQVLAADTMMDAVFRAAEPGEERLGLIDRRALLTDKFAAVVDPPHVVRRVQDVRARALVGVDNGSVGDVLADQIDRRTLAGHNKRHRAPIALADRNHDLALAGLFLREPAIGAFLFFVRLRETERNIANKISRGGFTAVFLLQCMEAIGIKRLQLGNDD